MAISEFQSRLRHVTVNGQNPLDISAIIERLLHDVKSRELVCEMEPHDPFSVRCYRDVISASMQ